MGKMESTSNYMGFDEFIYEVIVTEKDGSKYLYEFGNKKHAEEFCKQEVCAKIIKHPIINVLRL